MNPAPPVTRTRRLSCIGRSPFFAKRTFRPRRIRQWQCGHRERAKTPTLNHEEMTTSMAIWGLIPAFGKHDSWVLGFGESRGVIHFYLNGLIREGGNERSDWTSR